MVGGLVFNINNFNNTDSINITILIINNVEILNQ